MFIELFIGQYTTIGSAVKMLLGGYKKGKRKKARIGKEVRKKPVCRIGDNEKECSMEHYKKGTVLIILNLRCGTCSILLENSHKSLAGSHDKENDLGKRNFGLARKLNVQFPSGTSTEVLI